MSIMTECDGIERDFWGRTMLEHLTENRFHTPENFGPRPVGKRYSDLRQNYLYRRLLRLAGQPDTATDYYSDYAEPTYSDDGWSDTFNRSAWGGTWTAMDPAKWLSVPRESLPTTCAECGGHWAKGDLATSENGQPFRHNQCPLKHTACIKRQYRA